MAQLSRWRFAWSGFSGGPGVSTLFTFGASTPTAAMAAFKAFFEAVKVYLPSTVTIAYPSSFDLINDNDGSLQGSGSVSPAANTVGGGASSYSAPSGLEVKWVTGQIVHSHRAVGRTILVPCAGIESGGGAPLGTAVTAVAGAGNALIAALVTDLRVWNRPVTAKRATPTNPARPGTNSIVTSCTVPPKFTVLRSRRD
jgi:hypothetical protein